MLSIPRLQCDIARNEYRCNRINFIIQNFDVSCDQMKNTEWEFHMILHLDVHFDECAYFFQLLI